MVPSSKSAASGSSLLWCQQSERMKELAQQICYGQNRHFCLCSGHLTSPDLCAALEATAFSAVLRLTADYRAAWEPDGQQ